MLRSIPVLILACACATPRVVAPTVAPEHQFEKEPLPPDPETEKLDGNIPAGDWVEPLEAGSCVDGSGKPVAGAPKPCPARSGIALSEAKSARFGLYKIRYKELRVDYESDRKVWAAQRELYEKRLQLADQAIQDLQPTWWDRHKAEFGVIGGFMLGTVMTVAVYAVAH